MIKLLSLLTAVQILIRNSCLATPLIAADRIVRDSSTAELEKRSNNINELTAGQCKNLIAIYAKGTSTTEDAQKSNYDALGSAWFSNIVKAEGGTKYVVRQGVNYKAEPANAVFGVEGSTELFNLIKRASLKCPSGKIVLGGYSQGAEIVHNALARFDGDSDSRNIVAITLFGDPWQDQYIENVKSSVVKKYCHSDDSICHGGLNTGGGHQTYSKDCPAAAKWIHAKVAAAGRSNDK